MLLAKDPNDVGEIVNDIDGDLTHFWRTLQHPDHSREFIRRASVTPFSEAEFAAVPDADDPVSRALSFFVSVRQSLAGRRKCFATMTTSRTRRNMNEQASAWLSAVDGLSAVRDRLMRVAVLNRDAVDVIRQHDKSGVLFYLDPPYVPDYRATPDVYRREMTEADHVRLLDTLAAIRHSAFVLSGYRCDMYDRYATRCGWNRVDFDLPNNAAGGKAKRRMTESCWLSYER